MLKCIRSTPSPMTYMWSFWLINFNFRIAVTNVMQYNITTVDRNAVFVVCTLWQILYKKIQCLNPNVNNKLVPYDLFITYIYIWLKLYLYFRSWDGLALNLVRKDRSDRLITTVHKMLGARGVALLRRSTGVEAAGRAPVRAYWWGHDTLGKRWTEVEPYFPAQGE